MKSVLWICLCALLAGVVRCHNLREVIIDGRVYFLDPDCYSRMTRAKMIVSAPGGVVRHHLFESYPEGVESHTTAPLDYLIVGLKGLLDLGFRVFTPGEPSALRTQTLDLAGALISPLLGVATCVWLGIWARYRRRDVRLAEGQGIRTPNESVSGPVPLFFAISPILVHGTAFGRPDHQSLMILFLTVALGAECQLAGERSRRWSLVSGLAWAFALWVSLYEPLVLFSVTMLLWVLFAPRCLFVRERLPGVCVFVVVLGTALWIEGWRILPPDASTLPYLQSWSRSIGELAHPSATMIFQWLGWGCIAAPVLLVMTFRRDRLALPVLVFLAMVFALTCWQLRWGYFLALIFAMSLPWQLAALRKASIAWLIFVASLWPMLQEWDRRLFPEGEAQRQIAERRMEATVLRSLLEDVFDNNPLRLSSVGFIAPWWLSPSIAYWTGHHGVAGSSHESLPGFVDTARFYLAENPNDAAAILRARNVAWVLADDAGRVISTSAALLGTAPPKRPLALTLAEYPFQVPRFLVEEKSRHSRAAASSRETPLTGVPTQLRTAGPRLYRIYLVQSANFPP